MHGIYRAYTWYMPCIYKVFLKCRFDGQFLFSIIPSFNIRLLWITALTCPSIHENNISISIVYTWDSDIPGIYRLSEYTWYIHGTSIYRLYTSSGFQMLQCRNPSCFRVHCPMTVTERNETSERIESGPVNG